MAAILFYLFVKPLSLLPLSLLHKISDVLCFFIDRVFGYRKNVVMQNLNNSFPNLTKKEIADIRHKFYHHFTDLIVESVKIFSISEKEVLERFKVTNPEILDKYFDDGQSVIITGGHYSNWEMFAVGGDQYLKHQTVAIYHKLASKFMDAQMLATRTKFGMKLISRQEVKDFFTRKEVLTATIFGVDQSPSIAKRVYWTNFLNQDTPVMFGAEKFAKEHNLPVVFNSIRTVKRGYYEMDIEVLLEDPSKTAYGEITEAHTKRLEKQILEAPQYWLWTHKRWKRKRNAEEILEKEAQIKQQQKAKVEAKTNL